MEKRLFTSESVTEGHPDKVCDAISDAILDACMKEDPMSRVACETAACTGFVLVTGELTTNAYVDIPFVLPLLTPYIGGGIGYGRFESDNVMPMQLMLGIDAEIFVIPVIGSFEYRYLQSNRSAKSANERNKFYSHILMAKLRYEF